MMHLASRRRSDHALADKTGTRTGPGSCEGGERPDGSQARGHSWNAVGSWRRFQPQDAWPSAIITGAVLAASCASWFGGKIAARSCLVCTSARRIGRSLDKDLARKVYVAVLIRAGWNRPAPQTRGQKRSHARQDAHAWTHPSCDRSASASLAHRLNATSSRRGP